MPLNPSVRNEVSANILKYERKIGHLYLDSVGKVTVGVGHMIANRNLIAAIPMYKKNNKLPGAIANVQEKQQEYDNIAKQRRGYNAAWYEQYTTLLMKDADINAQLSRHIDTFYLELQGMYTKAKGYPDNFDNLDKDVQIALFDMIFNLGQTKLSQQYTMFDKALKASDWKNAAAHSSRIGISSQRNNYVKQKFLAAASRATSGKQVGKP